jgi:hypothetical protein
MLSERSGGFLDALTEYWVPGFLFLVSIAALNHDPRIVSDVTYGAVLVFLIGGTALAVRQGRSIAWGKFTVVPLGIFAVWSYGVLLGLANGVPPFLVFRNFAAMSLFPFVFLLILLLAPKPKFILFALVSASLVYVFAVFYLLMTVTPQGSADAIGLMSFRYHYYLTTVVATAVMLTLSIRSLILGPFKLWQMVLAVGIFVAVFYSGSRAFYAAMAGSMFVLALALLPRWTSFYKPAALGLVYLLAGVALLWGSAGSLGDAMAAVQQSVAMEFAATSPRSQQAAQLIPELGWFGHGLGAPLTSGYERDPVLTYAFELSYISLAHKVGLIGLLAFVACVSIHLARSVITLVRSNFRAEMILSVGLMGFLISSWWNPTIFAPLFVCLFCASMYIERTVSHELSTSGERLPTAGHATSDDFPGAHA